MMLLLLVWVTPMLVSQINQSIGAWRAHLPYQRGLSVAQSEDQVFYATALSVFSIDKQDLSVSFISKVDGLSDVGVSKVRYDHFNDQLFIIYDNANIDIIKGNEVINIPNILSSSVANFKSVNEVHFVDENEMYFATNFGIVVFDPQTFNFGSTLLTQIPVNQMTTKGSIIYAATDEGIYTFDESQNNNFANFDNWSLLGVDNGLPVLYESKSLINWNDQIFFGVNGSLYGPDSSNGQWLEIERFEELELNFLSSNEETLVGIWRGRDFDKEVIFFNQQLEKEEPPSNCVGLPSEIIFDNQRVWFADFFDDIRISEGDNSCQTLSFNSPYSFKSSDIAIKEDQVLVASGGVSENFTFLFSRDGFFLSRDNNWNNFNQFRKDDFAELDLLSVYRVAFHPSNNKIYAGSFWAGLLEMDVATNSRTLYNKTNSSLRGSVGDPARERVSGLAFDEEENLWVTTFGAAAPINVLTPEGEWLSFSVPGRNSITDIVIDDFGYKWMPLSNGGVLVFDSGASIQNLSDDRFRYITTSNSELETNNVLSVAVDNDSEVWVGSVEGPVIFDCGNDAFDDERCQGLRKKVVQDGIPAILLADQEIRVIAIDGGDNKWFGTRNGLFVQSKDGENQIDHFTTDNSPLFDNTITALEYDPQTGIMWVGTNKGLLTYRSESTGAEAIFRDDRIYAFPNPVPPNFNGPVAITGLIDQSNVKITDINGRLVKEIVSNGGQAIWDRLNQKGEEVASGVYLVFLSETNTFDQPDAFVTKIMLLK